MTRSVISRLMIVVALVAGKSVQAQDPDLLKLVDKDKTKKEFVTAAFKSSRVINGQSIEFLGKGVLDFRILHRFGVVSNGAKQFFGLDEASMRLGFDYGLGKNLMVGVGRTTSNKEYDGFLKFRLIRQSTGPGSFPVSVVVVSGITLNTLDFADEERKNYFSSRLGYYSEIIIGRKFTEHFTLQLSPVFVHRNLVANVGDDNDTYALGIGARMKFSKRMAFVVDYHPILAGRQQSTKDPLSMGIDIETGGHVFQLHFSNSAGMNEKEFITNTKDDFWKGEIRFGFNLSRVFTVWRPKSERKK
jgi:Membrane bound beta barrel domain (DUF5777)